MYIEYDEQCWAVVIGPSSVACRNERQHCPNEFFANACRETMTVAYERGGQQLVQAVQREQSSQAPASCVVSSQCRVCSPALCVRAYLAAQGSVYPRVASQVGPRPKLGLRRPTRCATRSDVMPSLK
eukprot:UN3201